MGIDSSVRSGYVFISLGTRHSIASVTANLSPSPIIHLEHITLKRKLLALSALLHMLSM